MLFFASKHTATECKNQCRRNQHIVNDVVFSFCVSVLLLLWTTTKYKNLSKLILYYFQKLQISIDINLSSLKLNTIRHLITFNQKGSTKSNYILEVIPTEAKNNMMLHVCNYVCKHMFIRRTICRKVLVKDLCVKIVPPGKPTCVRTR